MLASMTGVRSLASDVCTPLGSYTLLDMIAVYYVILAYWIISLMSVKVSQIITFPCHTLHTCSRRHISHY